MQTRKHPIEKQFKYQHGKNDKYQQEIYELKEEIKLLKQSKKQRPTRKCPTNQVITKYLSINNSQKSI